MSDYNRRSCSTLWRLSRVDMSRALNIAVLNVDSCTIGEVYGNNIDCILLSENTVESDLSRNAEAAGCSELNTVECELGLASDSGANVKSDNANFQLADEYAGLWLQNVVTLS